MTTSDLFRNAPPVSSPRADALLAGLTDAQRAVVLHPGGPCRVQAVAGAGKTRSLAARVAHLHLARGVPLQRQLAITFTRKAAQELRARVARFAGREGADVVTFHSLAQRVLATEVRGFGARKLLDDKGYRILLDTATGFRGMKWRQVDMPDLLAFVELAKARGARPDSAAATLLANARYAARVAPGRRPAQVLEAYGLAEVARVEANAATFADWLVECAELLAENEIARRRWAGKWDHLLVDETQDNCATQWAIVGALADEHRNVVVCGDAEQAIYGWRGAQPELLRGFDAAWPGTVAITMADNFRSGTAILDTANVALADVAGAATLRQGSPAAGAGLVRLRSFANRRAEAETITREIVATRAEGGTYGDCLVMVRTGAAARAIEEALAAAKVPHVRLGIACFWARPEVLDLLAYLRVAWRKGATMDDVRATMFAPSRFLSHSFADAVAAAARSVGPDAGFGAVVAQAVLDHGKLHGGQRHAAADWAELIDAMRARIAAGEDAARPGALVQLVAATTKYREWARERAGLDADDSSDAVAELVGAAAPFADCGALLAHAKTQRELAEKLAAAHAASDTDAVVLSTIHRQKGMEVENVWLIGCHDGHMPHSRTEDAAEERRVFYVAVTRAKRALRISYARAADDGSPVRISPYADEVIEALGDLVAERDDPLGAEDVVEGDLLARYLLEPAPADAFEIEEG